MLYVRETPIYKIFVFRNSRHYREVLEIFLCNPMVFYYEAIKYMT